MVRLETRARNQPQGLCVVRSKSLGSTGTRKKNFIRMTAQACSRPATLLLCLVPELTRALCPLSHCLNLCPWSCGHISFFCRCSVDSSQGRLPISAMLPWCTKIPVLEGREEMRRRGSRDTCASLEPRVYCKKTFVSSWPGSWPRLVMHAWTYSANIWVPSRMRL